MTKTGKEGDTGVWDSQSEAETGLCGPIKTPDIHTQGWSLLGPPVGCGKTITNTTRSRCLSVHINETEGKHRDEDNLNKTNLGFLLFGISLEGHEVQFTTSNGMVCENRTSS